MSKVPEGWRKYSIGDVVSEIDAGTSVNSQDKACSDGEKGVLKTSCVSLGYFCPDEHKVVVEDEVARLRVPVQGDRIILSRMNTPELVGANGYVPSDIPNLFLPDRLWQINSDRSVCSTKWLAQYLASPVGRGALSACATGTSGSMKNISKAKFKEIRLLLPPLPEQKKIAAILSSVDEAIAATQAVIDQTRKVKQGLLQDLFTRGIGHTRFKQTEIGEIPEAWEVKRLDDLATVERGRFSARPRNDLKYYGGEIPFVQTGDVTCSEVFLKKHSQSLNEAGLKVSKLFPKNTILITIAANIGDVALTKYEVAFPDSLVGIIANPQWADTMWLLYALHRCKEILDGQATQNAQKNINLQILKPLLLPVPSIEEQRKISSTISGAIAAIAEGMATLKMLVALKRGLMQDLLSGSVRVTTP